jgi:hypothetical protein
VLDCFGVARIVNRTQSSEQNRPLGSDQAGLLCEAADARLTLLLDGFIRATATGRGRLSEKYQARGLLLPAQFTSLVFFFEALAWLPLVPDAGSLCSWLVSPLELVGT